ncbi:ferredoxin [Nocardioides deserti]|uniref:Ferredoxin n=1 Tax=Nocardioides deserti TaxID=1588644 RepID=A0ABR6U5C9_9ACTN|nr:ferredoxin [Nocardioides deserti]MBC2959373.1 ferredoxin [Nocardioides deserti]GGO73306.1 ferredoxin [Nocardioides deserti]
MRVSVDLARCDRNGLCVMAAPEVFQLDSGGLRFIEEPDEELRPDVEDAVASCPAGAIALLDITTPPASASGHA